MGNLPNCCCCGKNNNNNRNDINQDKIAPKTSINLLEYDPKNYYADDINRIKNRNNNNKSIDDSDNSYDFWTLEEILEINEKIKKKIPKYQQMPLKSSDINIIYRSGLIQ